MRSKTIQIYTTNPALLESEMVTTLTHSLQVTVVAIDYFVQPLGMVVKRWLPPRLICEIMCICTKGARVSHQHIVTYANYQLGEAAKLVEPAETRAEAKAAAHLCTWC